MYIILPIAVMSDMFTNLLSQLFEDTYKRCVFCALISSEVFCLFSWLGKILLIGMKNANIVIIAKGILLLVSPISSDTLMFISININKNKIDTAPTYTNK